MKNILSVSAEPYPYEFIPEHTALLIIDMQRDFLEPGGFGEMLGNDVSQLRRTIEPNKRLLGLPKAAFELGVDNERRPQGRQVEGNEGIDFFAACGHAFVSACCALRHVLAGSCPGTTSFQRPNTGNAYVPCRPT